MPAQATMTRTEFHHELSLVQGKLAKVELYEFVKAVWPIVEPTQSFVDNWHIRLICEQLEAVTRGEIKNLIINVPPGCMKSLLVSVMWPAWEWASDDSRRYLKASYGQDLANRDNVKVRDIVQSAWYQSLFGVRFRGETNRKEKFETEGKGWAIATSVGGRGTGEHPDVIIIDDPTSADQARSDKYRKRANDWYTQTLSTRGVARDVATVIIMQRLHEKDLTGYLMDQDENGEWVHLCLPMQYETSRESDPDWQPDPLDPRTEPGELLWPDLFTHKKVRKLTLVLGPYGAAGQLQQRPAPEGGGLFKRDWFEIVEHAPKDVLIRVRGWDIAGTEAWENPDADWTAGVLISMTREGTFYVEDVVYDQLSEDGVNRLMKQTAKLDGRSVLQREEREGGSSGKAVTRARARLLRGFDYAEVIVNKADKVGRARPLRGQAEARNVKLVAGLWNRRYLDELAVFPTGEHDDQVDGSSCAFNAIIDEEPGAEGLMLW